MHCMGGSAIKVAGTDNGLDQSAYYYHIKPLATNDSIPCIYVAPQGNSDGTWNGAPDHIFFSDMLNLFKDTLCIDTTRVFCVGFSFGAMFTYSLSLEFADKLRAVAVMLPPIIICISRPTNICLLPIFKPRAPRTVPVPGSTPMRTSLAGNIACLTIFRTTGVRYRLLSRLQPAPHVPTEFSGCKDGYPARFCSFVGGHQCTASDPGSSTNWIPGETWTFLKQFLGS